MSGKNGGEEAPPPACAFGYGRSPSPANAGEDLAWRRALAAFQAAEGALRACERRTSGAPWAEQDAVEEEYGACLDALHRALRRLLRVPVPDLAALAAKIELIVEHEVATLTGGEACMAALRRDARRLGAESVRQGTGKVSE
jgi:hypothetical protein